MPIYFISDLHLSRHEPRIGDLFLEFLQDHADKMQTLYILGDLFDAWIGDDAVDPVFQPHIQAIQALSCPVYFVPGNRDFLVTKQFEQMLDCTILEDPIRMDFFGEDILLSHGDIFCTDDLEYQKFRQLVRDPAWRNDFLSKSVENRLKIAKELRAISQEKSQEKTAEIMDVNKDTVDAYMKEYEVKRLIHGHTHRLHHHHFDDHKERIVLGDWKPQLGNYLVLDESALQLKTYPTSL